MIAELPEVDFDRDCDRENRSLLRVRNRGRSAALRSADTYEGVVNDPISLHKYLYAGANPINELDPSGHDGLSDEAFSDADEEQFSQVENLQTITSYVSGGVGSVETAMSDNFLGTDVLNGEQWDNSGGDDGSDGSDWDILAAYVVGFFQGAAQGTLNAVNGLTDLFVDSDWSNGIVYDEDPAEHAVSVDSAKFGWTALALAAAFGGTSDEGGNLFESEEQALNMREQLLDQLQLPNNPMAPLLRQILDITETAMEKQFPGILDRFLDME